MNYAAATALDVAAKFRHVMSLSPTPVTVVSATTVEGPQAIVIGSFVSASLEPPLIGFFVGKWTRMWQPMNQAVAYCVNLLAESQAAVSQLFVTEGIDRFGAVAWEAAANGAPALEGAIAWIEAKPYSVTDAGDHDLILLQVTGLRTGSEAGPLIYLHGQYSRTVVPD